LCTRTPSIASIAATSWSVCVASMPEQVRSTTSRSCRESATSIAVTIPPCSATTVATCPTSAWSGVVCRRTVIEYDDGVAVAM
jgi:hypothetical protein